MKKTIMAALVIFTLLISSVVCSAATATTVVTCTEEGVAQVQTTVSGLTKGSMATYLLYGTGTIDDNGTITNTSESTPTEQNILYIDQINSVDGDAIFTAKGLDFTKVVGSKVLAGSNMADYTVQSDDLDNDILTFNLSFADMEWTNIASVTVSYTVPTTDTNAVADVNTITVSNVSDNKVVKVPVAATFTLDITTTDTAQYATDAVTITNAADAENTISGDTGETNRFTAVGNNDADGNYVVGTAGATYNVVITTKAIQTTPTVIVDSTAPLTEDATIDGTSYPARTYIIQNKVGKPIFMNIKVEKSSTTTEGEKDYYVFSDLSTTTNDVECGIQLVDQTGTNFFDDATDITFEMYYMGDSGKVYLTGNGNTYQ